MKILIWSKDRASQLDILLNSIKEFCSFTPNIEIIYLTSSEYFEDGYALLKNYHTDVSFIKEESFFRDTLKSVINSKTVCLCTDDCVFYRKFDDISNIAESHIFSYRLGLNTVAQDIHNNTFQPYLSRHVDHGNTISWNWTEHNQFNNYGYPFALDGHVYNSSLLTQILNDISFSTTNELETALFYQKHRISNIISSYKESCMVNVPVNTITGVTRNGEKYSYNLMELNERFLSGEKFMYNFNRPIIGCHQEFEIISR